MLRAQLLQCDRILMKSVRNCDTIFLVEWWDWGRQLASCQPQSHHSTYDRCARLFFMRAEEEVGCSFPFFVYNAKRARSRKNLARSGGRNAYFPISPGHFDAVPADRWRSYPGTECDERPNPSTFAGSLPGRTAAGPATHWQHSPEPDRVLGGLAACFAWFWGGSDSIP